MLTKEVQKELEAGVEAGLDMTLSSTLEPVLVYRLRVLSVEFAPPAGEADRNWYATLRNYGIDTVLWRVSLEDCLKDMARHLAARRDPGQAAAARLREIRTRLLRIEKCKHAKRKEAS